MRDSNLLFFAMRAARNDVKRARSQWPLGLVACAFVAAVAAMIAWGM